MTSDWRYGYIESVCAYIFVQVQTCTSYAAAMRGGGPEPFMWSEREKKIVIDVGVLMATGEEDVRGSGITVSLRLLLHAQGQTKKLTGSNEIARGLRKCRSSCIMRSRRKSYNAYYEFASSS